jgi:TonB-linked SusC/RagA family outer membrane protein
MKICANSHLIPRQRQLKGRWIPIDQKTIPAGLLPTVLELISRQMKLITLLTIITLVQASATGYSQKVTIRENNISVENVLRSIEKQTGYAFFYHSEDIRNARISISLKDAPITEALDHCFKNLPLSYKIIGNTIAIRKKVNAAQETTPGKQQPEMLPTTETTRIQPVSILSEAKTNRAPSDAKERISGRVTDEKGEALPGVNILIKGTLQGTTSNDQGNFALEVEGADAVLVFSFVGFQNKEVVVGKQMNINVQLIADTKALDEVVVTALGLKREKRSLGYAVGEVSSKEINRVPQENVLGGLQGKVTGLQINNSSPELNAETHVYIRGTNSLTNNNDPLIIVDGVPSGNPNVLADISADNIASVSVLKGPSAAALYGSRAGNGVLIITTKNGNADKKGLGVSFSSGYTSTVPYQFIEMQNKFTTGKNGNFDESAYQHWYGPSEGTSVAHWNTGGQTQPLKFYSRNRENFFQKGFSLINDVSVGGTYDKGDFRVAFNHLKGNGNTPGMELNRLGVTLSGRYKVAENLTVTTNLNLLNSFSSNLFTQLAGQFSYIDINTLPPHVDVNELRDYWEVKNEKQRNLATTYNNPWFEALEHRMPFERDRRIGNVTLNWNILPDLTLMGRISESFIYEKNEEISPYTLYGAKTRLRGGYNLATEATREINADFLLSYKKSFGKFYLAPTVGGNVMRFNSNTTVTGGDNLVLPNLYTASNVERAGLNYSSGTFKKEINSVYGMVSANYNDLFYLDLTARNDWSSTLPIDNRSYFYPSVSSSVLVSDLFSLPVWINLAKVRAGWAQVGKDTNPYTIHNVLTRGNWADLTLYTNPANLTNTRLKPEIATSIEAGADVALLKNRIRLDFTVYKMQNKNQILDVNVSQMSGFNAAKINAGVVENTGTEIGLHLIPFRNKKWQWNSSFNFTRERNKLTELTPGVDRVTFWQENGASGITRVGEQLGDMFGYDALRVKDGPYKGWALLNANGKLQQDNSELVKIGNYMNKFLLGMQNSVTYKSITLSVSLDWRHGGQFYSNTMQRFARSGIVEDYKNGVHSSTFTGKLDANSFGGDLDRISNEIKTNTSVYRDGNVWIGGRTQELGGFLYNGNYSGAFIPGVISDGKGGYNENFGGQGTRLINTWEVHEPGGGYWDIAIANRFVYDASFLKLRELAVSYDLPVTALSRIGVKKASVSVFTRNIMVWTAAKIGIDPELAYMRRQNEFQSRGIERFNGAGPWIASGGATLKFDF